MTTRTPTNDANIKATNDSTNLDTYENFLAKQLPVIWQPNPAYELSEISDNLGRLPAERLRHSPRRTGTSSSPNAESVRARLPAPALPQNRPGVSPAARPGRSAGRTTFGGYGVIGFLFGVSSRRSSSSSGVLLLVFLLAQVDPRGRGPRRPRPPGHAVQIAQFNGLNGTTCRSWDQFYQYSCALVHQNLGYSVLLQPGRHGADHPDMLPKTLFLVGISTVVALVIAVPLGILQVVRRNKPVDYVVTGLSFILYAMPAFLLGTLLILYFAIDLTCSPWLHPEPDGGHDPRPTPGPGPPRLHPGRAHRRLVQPLHALVDDGGHDRGLRPHGPGQGGQHPGGSSTSTPCATPSSPSSPCWACRSPPS